MPRPIQLQNVVDFSGGLNKSDDLMQLADNEAPVMLNVNVGVRGGFRLRNGVREWVHTTDDYVTSLHSYVGNGNDQVLYQTFAGGVYHTDGTSIGTVGIRVAPLRSTTFAERIYMVNNEHLPIRWDGSTVVQLDPPGWNSDFTSPTPVGDVGKMPNGKVIASHQGCVFVGNINEAGNQVGSRIRWSHPNQPEDWRDVDYIDIDVGHDGDEITALVPVGDHMLIFKNGSCYALYGYPPESFSVVPVSQTIGCPSQEAVITTENGVYAWSEVNGLVHYTGKGFNWMFSRLFPLIRDKVINDQSSRYTVLGYSDRRVWVSVGLNGSNDRNRVFAMDTQLDKDGTWTEYDLAVGPFLVHHQEQGRAPLVLAGRTNEPSILELDKPDWFDAYEFIETTPIESHIESHVRTKWFDLKQPAVVKRWKRPEVVAAAGADAEIHVSVFRDWNGSFSRSAGVFGHRTLAFDQWGVWGVYPGEGFDQIGSLWGTALWGGPITDLNVFARLSPLGTARSVSLDFNGPKTNDYWGLDSITLKYIPRRVRS